MKKFIPMRAEEIVDLGQGPQKGPGAVQPAAPSSLLGQQMAIPIVAMGVDPALLAQMSERVQSLNAQDLEDLSRRVAGAEVQNARVNALTIEDIQGIEALFRDQRAGVLVTLASTLGNEGTMGQQKVSVSCCCCTPCCSCAASEPSPFDE